MPFVGGTYNLNDRAASVQRTVNLMPVPMEPGNEEHARAFLDVPGLVVFLLIERLYYTSRPYAAQGELDQLDIGLPIPISGRMWAWPEDQLDIGRTIPTVGTLATVLQTYNNAVEEKLDIGLTIPQTGALVVVLQTYNNAVEEKLDIGLTIPQVGSLPVVLVAYTNALEEKLDIGLTIPMTGTLV